MNGRHVVSDQVNLEDLLTVRPGGIVRMNSSALPAEGHVLPLNHPFAFDSIIGTLNYFDQSRQNLSGVNSYFNGTDASALNRTATGLSMMTTQSAQRVEQIARMFATGVEYLFSCVLELLQKHANKTQIFHLRGKWYAVDPLAWSRKRDLKIAVGVGAGNKDSMLAQLNQMLAQQMQIGLPIGIADATTVYNTASEITKLQGFAQPERFWVDPAQKPPQQPQPPLPLLIEQMKTQAGMQEAQINNQLKAQTAQLDAQTQQQIEQMKLSFEKWKVEYQAQVDMALEQMKLSEGRDLELTKIGSTERIKGAEMQRADMSAATEQEQGALVKNMVQQFNELQQAMSQVVQTLGGSKVVGIEKVRDPKTGRMVGGRVKRADGSVEDVTIQ